MEETTMHFKILEARADVLGIWAELDSAFEPPLSSLVDDVPNYAYKLADNAINLAYYDAEMLIGCISFYANDLVTKKAYIAEFAIRKDKQGSGVGSLLLNRALDIAFGEKDMDSVFLEVRKDNPGAIRFYSRNGFCIAEDRSSKILMVKVNDTNT